MSPEAMEASIAGCRLHKATGRDLLSNEVMQAGGRPMADLAGELAIKIADTERWPKEFQGGRVLFLSPPSPRFVWFGKLIDCVRSWCRLLHPSAAIHRALRPRPHSFWKSGSQKSHHRRERRAGKTHNGSFLPWRKEKASGPRFMNSFVKPPIRACCCVYIWPLHTDPPASLGLEVRSPHPKT